MANLVRLSLRISPSLPFHTSATRLFNTSSSSRSVEAAAHQRLQLIIRPCCSFSTSVPSSTHDEKSSEVAAVSKINPSSSSPSSHRQLWKQPWGNISPFQLNEGLGSFGNALMNLSENLNNLLRNWSPFRLFSRMKEHEDYYKFKIPVPGLNKEDLKITVDDRYLVITGEHKEEEGGSSDADDMDGWYSQSFGYYNTNLLLPDDAMADDIKAELKNGVLSVTIPRSGEGRKNVREVKIQ